MSVNEKKGLEDMPTKLNPSRRYQKKDTTKISFEIEGNMIITRTEWIGDAFYFEAKRQYRIKSIRRKKKMNEKQSLYTGETSIILEGRMVS
jgi:hypothetical protein